MYRDNLEAAHQRIIVLEQRIKELETEKNLKVPEKLKYLKKSETLEETRSTIYCKLCNNDLTPYLKFYIDNSEPILCLSCLYLLCKYLPTNIEPLNIEPLNIENIESVTQDKRVRIYYVHRKDGFSHALSRKEILAIKYIQR